jgi:hypothetical protein
MTFFANLLMGNWRIVLIGTVIASLAGFSWLQTTRLKSAHAELAEIRSVAEAAQNQTEANLETIRSAIPVMVEQAREGAVRSYCNRHPTYCTSNAGSYVPPRVWTDGCSQTPSASGVDAPSTYTVPTGPDQEFIRECAETTALYNAWRELCLLNDKLCEVKE